MTPEEFRRIEELYRAAIKRPPGEQDEFLTQACGGNETLHRQLESLPKNHAFRREIELPLAAEGEAEPLFETTAMQLARPLLARTELVLAEGQMFGCYRILSLLGSGGMAEVYKAHDTRLNRPVVIKVLLQSISAQPDVRERFQREARVVANLKHPNICVLHDVGQQDELDYLVMEYLEGDTLARRLEKTKLPLAQVVEFGIQIIDALDTVHRQGIVHRDLKPQNIMLTPSGAKLLDFGLAKENALREGFGTDESALTSQGMIVGTLHYMAPEQLEGKEVDARADMFSFGAIVYEMVAGRKAFDGEDLPSVMAAILHREPGPIPMPMHGKWKSFEYIIRRCVAKNPDERWQSAHDVLLQLRWIAQADANSTSQPVRHRDARLFAALLLCGVLAVISVVSLAALFRNARSSLETYSEFLIHSSQEHPLSSPGFVSPDGRAMAFLSYDEKGNRAIWLRSFDSLDARLLRGTENTIPPLFWSPDSKQIAFFTPSHLKRIVLPEVPPQVLVEAQQIEGGASGGGAWSPNGTIVFSPGPAQPLFQVRAEGGHAVPATVLDEKEGEVAHVWPYFLPDGKHFIYSARNRNPEKTGLYAGVLGSIERKRILDGNLMAAYASPGYLLFVRDHKLLAQKFDTARLELSGDAVILASGLEGIGWYSVSQNGVLTVESNPNPAKLQLVWFTRKGQRLSSLGPPDVVLTPSVSPDGREVAVGYQPQGVDQTIWLLEAEHGRFSPFTLEGPYDETPVWSPDGKFIAFTTESTRGWIVRRKPTDGSGKAEDLAILNAQSYTADWSPDGRFIAFHTLDQESQWDCWLLPLTGDRKPLPLLKGPFDERQLQFSPDGHWIAYTSNASGRDEVYVQRFPISKEWARQVSIEGGAQPRWRRDGHELFYVDPRWRLMVVQIKNSSQFETEPPLELFQLQLDRGDGLHGIRHYDVSADGQRFLVQTVVGPRSEFVKVILNWTTILRQQVRSQRP